ncbi:MAG TPA: His/Gly/Thr/Pro-type tRNA ligase C-terminal domain-containing protein, partial [Chitinophagaceae bacterium]|nr:His/Gly/Thr/Pro-type tRNA ligase C-terminal domain-containing protein [Chitinophagaceae bacterium]
DMLENLQTSTKVLVANFSRDTLPASIKVAKQLRMHNIPTEIYPDQDKLKKQFGYADKKGIRFVVIIGDEELATGNVVVKDLVSGSQSAVTLEAVSEYCKQKL